MSPTDALGETRRSFVKKGGLLTATLATGGLTGCLGSNEGTGGGENSADTNTNDGTTRELDNEEILIASVLDEGYAAIQAAQKMKSRIEEETDGAFSVKISPGGSYGSQPEIVDLCKEGTVDANIAGFFPYEMYAPEYEFFEQPYVVEDWDHLQRIFDSEIMEEGEQVLRENANQFPIGQQTYLGTRKFVANFPVRSPDDVEGVDLRIPELDPWLAIWEEVGVNPTPVALPELYSALESGVVDASEVPPDTVQAVSLYEVISHISSTDHVITTTNLYVNDDYFDSLDETYQELLTEVAEETTQEASEQAVQTEQEYLDLFQEEGVELIEDVDREAFRSAVEPAVEKLFEERWARTWEEIQEI